MDKILELIKDVFTSEAESVLEVRDKVDDNFLKAVDLIFNSTGKLIISGIGKSGLIGKKMSATLNSTGTPSVFLHPVEAMHGDLGIVAEDDVFIGISNSGETAELNNILPVIRKLGCKMIAFTGRKTSTLGRKSDITIDVGVKKEACPLGLAPTSSTTALLAAGDALSVALINRRNFQKDDFKKFHPGGSLGKRLSSMVEELMLDIDKTPVTRIDSGFKDALGVLDEKSLGAVFIVDEEDVLKGLITDGDIRHFIASGGDIKTADIKEVMTSDPLYADLGTPVFDCLNLMEKKQITVLPVVDKSLRVMGILHLHDILGKGELEFSGAN